MRQNAFAAGVGSGPHWGSLRRSTDLLGGFLGRGMEMERASALGGIDTPDV